MATDTQLHAMFRDAWSRAAPRGAFDGVLAGFADLSHWRPWLDDAHAVLDAAETDRAMRMKRRGDREMRVLAYALHRLFLAEAMGVPPARVALSRDALGAPAIAGSRWRTSLSHAGGAVAFAACADGAVGIDIEPLARAADTPAIEEEILHASERVAGGEATRAAHGRRLLDAWVRKEAYLKACGTGLAVPMANFALPEGARSHLLDRDGTLAHGVVETRGLALDAGHAAAICTRPALPIQLRILEPR